MSTVAWTIAMAIVAIGACAQGSLGFGLGLLAAPVLALINDDFVPGPLLMVAFVLTILVATRERGRLDVRGVKWAVIGRVPGSVVGAVAVVTLPDRTLIVVFATLVLIGVILSVVGWSIMPTPTTLFTAGATSGVMGSITSIGGPPMALVYQHRSGPELRATLALFFVFGSALSIFLLSIAGEIGPGDVRTAAALLPAMLVGYVASRWVGRWLDRGYLRPALLGFSAAASLTLLVVELLR
ncbi:MAG TPA: sulfite exporter TauE/SafE family protein [Ilumatobacteraceae bacterium]